MSVSDFAAARQKAGAWGQPHPLPDGLPDVDPFQPELLPDLLAPWLSDAADRMQVPMDLLAVPAW